VLPKSGGLGKGARKKHSLDADSGKRGKKNSRPKELFAIGIHTLEGGGPVLKKTLPMTRAEKGEKFRRKEGSPLSFAGSLWMK